MLFKNINFAWKTRRFWFFTATSRTRSRFARTTLGSFWLGFSNLLSIAALGIVYGTVFAVGDIKSYCVYLGIGLVIWNAISSSVSSAPNLFSNNSQNIRNLNISAISYTFEEWAFQIQTFFQSFILVFFVLLFINNDLMLNLLFFSWLPLANLMIFLYWFPLLICLIGVKYTDFSQLVPVILQVVFLVSPILYRKESLSNLEWITNYNLIYKILDPLRLSLIEGIVNYQDLLIILFINILGLAISFILLNKKLKELPFLVS